MGYQASKTRWSQIVKSFSGLSTLFALSLIVLSYDQAVAAPCLPDATSGPCTASGIQTVSVHALVIDPNAVVTPPLSSGGGGGGPSDLVSVKTKGGTITLNGRFAPNTTITALLSGVSVRSVTTDVNGYFALSVEGLGQGTYNLLLTAKDSSGKSSAVTTASFTIYVNESIETVISSVTFPPLLLNDGFSYEKGETVALRAKAIPYTSVGLSLDRSQEVLLVSDYLGDVSFVPTSTLSLGGHQVLLRQKISTTTSLTRSYSFDVVGSEVSVKKKIACGSSSDFSSDCKVNLIDFSILAYWHNRINFPKKYDLNRDGKIDLKDFSIMAYNWTG